MLRCKFSHFSFFKNILNHQRRARAVGRYTASVLLASMLTCSVPAPIAAAALKKAAAGSSSLALLTEDSIAKWIELLLGARRSQGRTRSPAPEGRGLRPIVAPSKEEKEARASSVRINILGTVVLRSREPMLFSAVPLDSEGHTIHSLNVDWESSDKQVVFIRKNGQAIAGKPGSAQLTAKVGNARESIRVTVVEGTKEDFGGKKKENSRRAPRKVARNLAGVRLSQAVSKSDRTRRRAHSSVRPSIFTNSTNSLMPLRDPMEDPLPDDETGSLYQPTNATGAPPGKRRPGGFTPSTAVEGGETGNKNFTFELPIVSLQGRGLDVELNLTYNSLLYNKSTDPFDSSTWLTYDVDSGYPAPGFRLGFGQIEDQGGFGFTLVDADGTRHSLNFTSANNYDTNDGTFIHFTGGSGWGTLFYPDGSRVSYGAAGGGFRSYPTQITDANGNYIQISYQNGVGPRISSIKDTLGRFIQLNYAANGDLSSITAPGLTGQPDREVMRFFYEDINFNASTLFDPSVNISLPAGSHVIKYIFLESSVESGNAHIGYRFDYSAYGMIYQTAKFRGMVLNAGGTGIANEGVAAAVTTYDYPGTSINTATGLTDCPTYSKRIDDWAGRTTGMNGDPNVAPFYTFSVNETNGISLVTAPDGTVTESHAILNPNQWNHGLINETFVDKQGSSALLHTVIDWEEGVNSAPRVDQVRTTNEAGQTKATVFTYTTYNNVASVSERDFTTDGTVSSTELRRRETSYVTSSSYINRRLLSLPLSVKVFAGGSVTPASRVDYAYDNYGTNHSNLTRRDDIIMHDPAFDPFQQTVETNCRWECFEWEFHNCHDWQWVCDYYNPYDPATDFRGNVTSITTYPDAANAANPITQANTYDIAGNIITAQVDCCQLKTFGYTDNPNTQTYAFQASETTGSAGGPQLTTGTTYDFNTGLLATSTDENSQVVSFFYNADSLRQDHVESPDGGVTYFSYSDTLEPDANGKFHYYIQTQTKLDAPSGTPRYVTSRRYFDGRDIVARTLDNFTATDGYTTQDTEYDVMGRAYRSSNPYFANSYSSAINPSDFWTSKSFDHLGRLTVITMPRGDDDNSLTTTAQTSYDGMFTTATDPAGKQRRQKVDALGRVVRLDEPDSSGTLGSTTSPNQATTYEYDVLDNLIHVIQPGPSVTQHHYFKYDSLSRMIRERQVEQAVNSSYDLYDPLTGNSSWSRKIEYNSSGLITDIYDARGVHTHSNYDTLNRVTAITYSDGTPAANYFYDAQTLPAGAPTYAHGFANGRLIAMTSGSGAAGTYFGYDAMGRVNVQRQVTGSATYSLSYTYNLGGVMTAETYPSGRTVNYVYDEGARLTNINDGSTTFANGLSYVAHGALKSETWGNGAVHSRTYNRRLQTSEVKLKQSSAGSELQRFNYSYGQVTQSNGAVDTSKNIGQIGRIDAVINGAGTKEWDQRFVYDELGRLSTAAEYQQGNNSIKTWQVQYTYDRWGNRFQSGSANSGVGYTPVLTGDIDAATNRFVSGGATPTTYDAEGNVTSDTKFRGMNYTYDANGRMTSATRMDQTTHQSSVYDCTGQRVQTSANGVTRTMVYDINGQNVAEYTGSVGNSLERENIYRGGQLLSVIEVGAASAAAPAGLSASLNGANISLNWSTASGATNYRVERKAAGGSYTLIGTTGSTSLTDTGVTSGSAYLYKVCAANAQGNCVSNFSSLALGTTITFATDPNITTIAQDPSGASVKSAKAAHITELRTAVNTVRNLAGLSAGTWTNPNVAAGSTISKDDVRDLREKLDQALAALAIQMSAYTDPTLVGAPNGTLIRGIHITELRQRVTSGTGTEGSGGGVCYKSLSQFVKDFYQGVLQRQPTAGELQQKTDLLTQSQLQGQSQLIGAAQNLGTALFTSSEYLSLNTTNAQYITDLYAGYLQRVPDGPGYNSWLGILNGGETRANIRQGFALSTEFQNNVNALCIPAGTGGGIKYVLSDAIGSARAIMNHGSYGSSSVISRHDYLPFGEEIWAGTGLRTTTQAYNTADKIRQKFAQIERDDVTGLDHTWWRKYESFSGRWTSPDPVDGEPLNPQSFNHYTYSGNDPVNFIDPTGLLCYGFHVFLLHFEDGRLVSVDYLGFLVTHCDGGGGGPGEGGGPGGGGGPQTNPRQNFRNFLKNMSQACKDALKKLGITKTVNKLAGTAKFYDVNTLQNQRASRYVGSLARRRETLGQWFDRQGHDAFTAVRVPRTGIYARGGESKFTGDDYFKLHEIVHLAYPKGSDLDASVAQKLGLTKASTESWSDAVSRFFNSQCTKKTP